MSSLFLPFSLLPSLPLLLSLPPSLPPSLSSLSQGLASLYQFQQSHPTFDLEGVLADQTKFYRDYIMRGLRGIRECREGEGPRNAAPAEPESMGNYN